MVTASVVLSVAAFAAGVTLMLVSHILVICWALRRGGDADADADADANIDADQERAAAADHGAGKGLSADELETLPCHDFSTSGGPAAPDCAVCLETFVAGERCRRLPRCDHSFHARCVDPWLKKSRCCPVCRADAVPNRELGTVAMEGETTEVEMEAERRSAAALEMVAVERWEHYSWTTLHSGITLR